MSDALSPALVRALTAITVHAPELRARVVDRAVTAANVRELRSRLANAVYEVFHQGRADNTGPVPRTLRDPDVERDLLEATPHGLTEQPARLVADDGSGTAVVLLHGVRVAVPAHTVRRPTRGSGTPSVLVRIPATRAALSPGFFLAHGSRGIPPASARLFRLYLHVRDEAAAVRVWSCLLNELETLELRYQAKVLSTRSSYPRQDAVVVYLDQDAWPAANGLASAVAGLDGLGRSVSPFCEPLAPGVSRAQEPVDARPGRSGLSFGEHRAGAIAEGLLDAALRNGAGTQEAVAAALRAAGVDPLRPHLNTATNEGFPERRRGVPES
ncbi:T3SS effector HopA1 family protein [Streptomyces sp. NRRL S-920]|uniref:T3SS effector HopA1 family protein n=1 Tax=Streptomyces sp. NRRL S-920 TaxID=1463921 RepID=UPI00068A5F2D|nr:T3SS effector HopA1 family protein [Streptomyces sp. NRRL S-920]